MRSTLRFHFNLILNSDFAISILLAFRLLIPVVAHVIACFSWPFSALAFGAVIMDDDSARNR